MHVAKFSKVLIKGRDWKILRHGGSRDQTIDKMGLRFLIAVQCVEVDCHFTDLDARTGDEARECSGDIGPSMTVKRLKYKHALGQNDWQHHNYQVASIASIKQRASCSGMLVMVLHQIANNQIRIDKSSLAHRLLSWWRAASAAALRISAKDIPLPFLLASRPLSDRMPGCTRMVAWSPATAYSNLSPGLIRKAFRIFSGIVVCPLLVTVECSMACPYLHGIPYLCIIPYFALDDKDALAGENAIYAYLDRPCAHRVSPSSDLRFAKTPKSHKLTARRW